VGRHVTVGLNGNNLTISSDRYGSASRLVIQSGTALASLGFAGGESAVGHDVAGNFGPNEPATGSGQLLTGNAANPHTAGLQMLVTLSSAQVGGGVQASATVSRGIASQLDGLLANMLDPTSGELQLVDDSFQQSLKDLADQKTKQTALMNAHQQSLLNQFNAMEQTLSQLQSVSTMLATQSANVNKTA
jgi:flagellar hook-associated protein 2